MPDAEIYHNNLNAVAFQTLGAEYYALCLQTYQLAKFVLAEKLAGGLTAHPAIVMDLDETVLNNAPYNAYLIDQGKNYHDDSWNKWCLEEKATLVPGAFDFITFARSQGVEVFFITSRLHDKVRAATSNNLYKLGILNKETAEQEGRADYPSGRRRLYMKNMPDFKAVTTEDILKYGAAPVPLKNKFDQRVFVELAHGVDIILSIGDNLADYAEYYGAAYDAAGEISKGYPSYISRRHSVLQDKALFGNDFILVPNTMYGGWLRALDENKVGTKTEGEYVNTVVRPGLDTNANGKLCNSEPWSG